MVMLQDADAKGIPHPDRTSERLLVHEMAHSYVNPVVDRHAAELAPSEKLLFAMVAQPMAAQAYKSWDVVIKESLVRATVVLFIRDHDGDGAAQKESYQQMDNGFYWMPELVALLAQQRGKGLEPAIPAVETMLEAWAAAHPKGPPAIPFVGPINAAFSRIKAGQKATLVVTHGQPALAAYVGAVRTKLMPEVAQVEATAFDLEAARRPGRHRRRIPGRQPGRRPPPSRERLEGRRRRRIGRRQELRRRAPGPHRRPRARRRSAATGRRLRRGRRRRSRRRQRRRLPRPDRLGGRPSPRPRQVRDCRPGRLLAGPTPASGRVSEGRRTSARTACGWRPCLRRTGCACRSRRSGGSRCAARRRRPSRPRSR